MLMRQQPRLRHRRRAQARVEEGSYTDFGFLSLFFFCAARQGMQKLCPHFKFNRGSELSQQGIPQQGLLHASCIAAVRFQ